MSRLPLMGIGGSGVIYLLLDEFLTNLAAGSVNGTAADPGPGTRTVTDTGNHLSISGGRAIFAGWVGDGDPKLRYGTHSRTAGRTALFTVRNTAGLGQGYGWGETAAARIVRSVFSFNAASGGDNLRILDNNVETPSVGEFDDNWDYHLAIILKAAGAYFFIKGGQEYDNWTLVWVSTADTTATMAPGITGGHSTSRMTAGRVAVPDDLISFAALTPGNYVGNCIIDGDVTWTSGAVGFVAREIDANNRLIAYTDGTNGKLDQIKGGVTTTLITGAIVYSAGARLRLVIDGRYGALYYGNVRVGTTYLVNIDDTVTSHSTYVSGAGSVANFAVYPRRFATLDSYGSFGLGNYRITDRWTIDPSLTDGDGIDLGDIDGDSETDVVAVNSTGTVAVYWYKQTNANGKRWTKYTVDATAGSKLEGVCMGDFDDDGEMEIATADQTGQTIRVYKPTTPGDPTGAWTKTALLTNRPNVHDVRAWDVDGDGAAELVYTWEGGTALDGGVHALKFTGTVFSNAAHWTDYVLIQHPGAWGFHRDMLDLAGNGSANDILFTARTGVGGNNSFAVPGIYWLQNTALGTPWPKTTIDSRNLDWLHVDIGDYSGDGNGLDIVANESGGADSPAIFDKNGAWSVTTVAAPAGHTGIFNVATIPGGGARPAFVAFYRTIGVYAHEWDGVDWNTALPIGYPAATHPSDAILLWHDVNGDGVDELFIANSDTGTGLFAPRLDWVEL